MVFECFSDCLLECSGMLGRLIGWLFECFSYCSVECLGMLGRLVGGV